MVVWPVVLGLLVLFLTALVRVLLDIEAVRRGNRDRAGALFRIFYLGPDFVILSVGLLVSSRALEAALEGHGVTTLVGARFSEYFGALLLSFFAAFALTVIVWLFTERHYKNFPLTEVVEQVVLPDGRTREETVYDIRVLRCLFGTSAGFWNLIVGNFVGVASVVAYAFFIYFVFVQIPPWLK